jgi:hypothetical protein
MHSGFSLLDWIFGKREPEFPYFEKYLEIEVRRSPYVGSQTVGAVCGISSLVAAAFQIGFGALTGNWGVASLIWIPAGIVQIGSLVWYLLAMNRSSNERVRLRIRAHRSVRKLLTYAHARRLRAQLGTGIGELLDAGAKSWLEIRQTFESQSWSAPSDSVYSIAKDKTLSAMDVAMARLVLLCSDMAVAGVDFVSPAMQPAEQLVMEMRQMAMEASKLVSKLRANSASLVGAEFGASELRDAAADLQRLSSALDEVEQLRSKL